MNNQWAVEIVKMNDPEPDELQDIQYFETKPLAERFVFIYNDGVTCNIVATEPYEVGVEDE